MIDSLEKLLYKFWNLSGKKKVYFQFKLQSQLDGFISHND
jgi:hypothetical protein